MSYNDLINVEEIGKKIENFTEDRGGVAFYCKNCKKLVEVERPNPRGYIFICKECGDKSIVLGTKEGLKVNYHIK